MKAAVVTGLHTQSIAIAFAMAVAGCTTTDNNTVGSYPAMNNNTAGPMGLSLWCPLQWTAWCWWRKQRL